VFGGGHAAYPIGEVTYLTLTADYVRPFGPAKASGVRGIDDGFLGALGIAFRW
jgi:hypothetical protein